MIWNHPHLEIKGLRYSTYTACNNQYCNSFVVEKVKLKEAERRIIELHSEKSEAVMAVEKKAANDSVKMEVFGQSRMVSMLL